MIGWPVQRITAPDDLRLPDPEAWWAWLEGVLGESLAEAQVRSVALGEGVVVAERMVALRAGELLYEEVTYPAPVPPPCWLYELVPDGVLGPPGVERDAAGWSVCPGCGCRVLDHDEGGCAGCSCELSDVEAGAAWRRARGLY